MIIRGKICLFLLTGVIMMASHKNDGFAATPPLMKEWRPSPGYAYLKSITIVTGSEKLKNEQEILRAGMVKRNIPFDEKGIPLRLEISAVGFPEISSSYKEKIESQGYHLKIGEKSILIRARSPQGVFYGIQTLLQAIHSKGRVPLGEGRDWPDLAARMIMVDPARQNENMDYYRRVIQFCAG